MKGFEIIRTIDESSSGKKRLVRDINPLTNHFCFDAESVRNNIEARCHVIRGELSYNTSLGINLGSDQKHLDLFLSEIILDTAGVKSIELFSSYYDSSARTYSAKIVVITQSNESIEVSI